ncbi:MAG: VOC family protein [Chloroflexi bacterium]|nr:VOC family protein [Chloroflexota bacterium]
MLTTFEGVIVWTEDVQRLLPFYRDVLKLPVEFESEAFIGFRLDETFIGLGKHSHVKGAARDPHRVMINFGVDDILAAFEYLRDHGVEFIREPENEEDAEMSIATFVDPDGNILQLFGPPLP